MCIFQSVPRRQCVSPLFACIFGLCIVSSDLILDLFTSAGPNWFWPLPVSSLHKLVPNVITLYLCSAPKPLLPPVSGTGLDSHSTAELLLRGLLLVLTDLNIFSAILYALEPNIQCLPTSCMKIHTLAQIQSEIPVTLRNRLQVVRGGLLSGSSQAWYDRCQCYLHFCRDSLIISISSGSHHGSQLPQ